jgi:membrane protease YdiL (CAAX protease family)
MAVECTFLAVPLIVLSLFLNSPSNSRGYTRQVNDGTTQYGVRFSTSGTAATKASESSYTPATNRKTTQPNSLAASIVTGIGAGIYEELVFRLILICTLMLVFQDILGISHQNSIILSVLVSAALFSAHHHVVIVNGHFETNVPFTWTEFGFRTIAGIYFAGLFAIRGFGIAAGTHAFYDIIATIINAVFFEQ